MRVIAPQRASRASRAPRRRARGLVAGRSASGGSDGSASQPAASVSVRSAISSSAGMSSSAAASRRPRACIGRMSPPPYASMPARMLPSAPSRWCSRSAQRAMPSSDIPGAGGFSGPAAQRSSPARTAPATSGAPAPIASNRWRSLRTAARRAASWSRPTRRGARSYTSASSPSIASTAITSYRSTHAICTRGSRSRSARAAVTAPPVSWMSGSRPSRRTASRMSLWNGFQPERWKLVNSSAS
jgi:hypothetical protein